MALRTGDIIGAGVSLIPAIFKGIQGIGQRRQARKINPTDPGFALNQGVIGNAESLRNRYGNYTLPGYDNAVNDIGASASQGFSRGVQGASSGGDVMDLATRIAYGQSRAVNDLNMRQSQGREQAYMQQLQGNEAEGAQYQAKNAYDRDIYQQKLREKAALMQSGTQNIYGALNSGANVGSALAMKGLSPNTTNTASTNPNVVQLDKNGWPIGEDSYSNKLLNRQYNNYYGQTGIA